MEEARFAPARAAVRHTPGDRGPQRSPLRVAANADLVLAYCVASKILAIQHGATLNSALQRLVFLCFFGHGAMTTFDYHRIRKT